MIVDFQHHFIPRELAKDPPERGVAVQLDDNGVPSMTGNTLLYDLDEHIRMMDYAGIDATFLTCPAGMCGAINSVNAGLIEISASRIVFATDYPQEIRSNDAVRRFVSEIRELGLAGQQILAGNASLLLNRHSNAAVGSGAFAAAG